MKMKREISMILMLISLVLTFSCIKKHDTKIMLRYSAPSFALYNKIRENIGKEFEKIHPEVRTVYEPISSRGFFEKLQTQVAGETEPDVYFMRDYELPIFVGGGAISNLNGFINNDEDFDLKDYHKILIDSYTIGNKIYGLPGSFTSGVIFYNKDLLSKAGYKRFNDLTWEKLIKVGKKLTLHNAQGSVQQFGIVLEYYDWITFILQNNGRVFSDDKKRCVINSPAAVTAVKYLKTLFKNHHITPNSVDLEQSEGE
ncbi:MAG: extracellular solute-binding protein, partial [Spirochaetes bacterium]|nr:extracellular solute-binding protein [Spirochaetota bacterium]